MEITLVTKTSIPNVLRGLTGEVRELIREDPRTVSMLAPRRDFRRPASTNTRGYCIELGRLGRRISVQLWIDRYSGLPSPRAWFGLASRSPSELSALLAEVPLARIKRELSTMTPSDVSSTGPPRFIHPLQRHQFGSPILEIYHGSHSFLGIYAPYDWPLSPQHRKALVADVVNLIAPVCHAFRELKSTGGPPHPPRQSWPRPTRAIERSAVRHVRNYLSGAGYKVLSREREVCGYDLHAVRGKSELHVEVKACKGSYPRFFLSRNEMRSAELDPLWRLAVVVNAAQPREDPSLLTVAHVKRDYQLAPALWEGTPSK